MITIYTFYKNSNTGVLVKKQHFEDISFNCPDYFYDINGKKNETICLKGFIEISPKKFNRESKKQKITK
jgi:hypothetical protein